MKTLNPFITALIVIGTMVAGFAHFILGII